jgi:hypothetical protein
MLETEGAHGIEAKLEAGVERSSPLPFVAGALGSVALSAGLMLSGRRHAAQFVGQWAPTLLLAGVFTRLARLERMHVVSGSAGGAGVH